MDHAAHKVLIPCCCHSSRLNSIKVVTEGVELKSHKIPECQFIFYS